ncbi:MAG: Gfo/Idh/MocA family oxidoreductase [Bacteroidales bacterium]|nr:Gfo/Idh/MocA family oxidoreductase [Bacteroidales bacterium]
MIKVITYGTYDLLHFGHIRLLERAKALGDYLIVGVTADGFDRARGKINVQQSLMERIEAVKQTGLADEIIIEEYEGQKIDDVFRYGVDVFAIGSDWEGKFDYLNNYCKVVYLPRTEGISSSDLRKKQRELNIGMVGETAVLNKYEKESHYVNGACVNAVCSNDHTFFSSEVKNLPIITDDLQEMLDKVDAVFIASHPTEHYSQIKQALEKKKHVLCKSPIVTSTKQWQELKQIAKQNGCILMDSIKTGYATAYHRLLLLVKSGVIGEIVSMEVTCTSLFDLERRSNINYQKVWNSISAWGPTAMLPVFQILGTDYKQKQTVSRSIEGLKDFDLFTKTTYVFPHSVASIKVGKGIKSEGELIISGTNGYIYVPAPWWKTDYFEIRKEHQSENKRYFYQLEGEGIRYELVSFIKSIHQSKQAKYISDKVSFAITKEMEDFFERKDFIEI